MSSKLSFVTLVALVAMTVANVDIPEYSQEAHKALDMVRKFTPVPTKVINPDGKVNLEITKGHRNYAAFRADYAKCSDNDGIQLSFSGLPTRFFEVSHLDVFLDEKKGSKPSTLLLIMTLDEGQRSTRPPVHPAIKEPFRLIIPVFQTPSTVVNVEENNPENFGNWAQENRIGLLPPELQSAFESSLQTQKLAFNFRWLKELLSYHLDYYEMSIPLYNGHVDRVREYTTRPVVVSKHTKNVLLDVVKAFEKKD